MKQIFTVFGFTLRDGAKKKSFLISTIILLVVVFGVCLTINLIDRFSGGDDDTVQSPTVSEEIDENAAKDKTCYFSDDAALIPDALELLQAAFPDYRFETVSAAQIEDCRTQIADSDKLSAITLSAAEDGTPVITVINHNFMNGISASTISAILSDHYIAVTLEKQGIGEDIIAFAQSSLPVNEEYAGNMNFSGYLIGIFLVMLTFFAIYFYGYGVSMSVASEKTSRVMETLIVSAKPSRILIGKCLAMGVLGLIQLTGVLVFGTLCYHFLIPADFLLMGMPLSLSAFTVQSAVLVLIYFILGYALYALMNAVCGASVSKIEDLNSAMMPVMLVQMISFYVAYFTALMASNESVIHKVALYVPFFSPFIMPFKLLNGEVATLDIVISIAALLAAIVIVAWISIRIYTASVLHYGSRKKFSELFRTKV